MCHPYGQRTPCAAKEGVARTEVLPRERRQVVSSIEKVAHRSSQGSGEAVHDRDRRVAGAALKIADIGAMNVSAMREVLLRPAFVLTQAAQIPAKAIDDVHALTVSSMSTIVLQTIGDNRHA